MKRIKLYLIQGLLLIFAYFCLLRQAGWLGSGIIIVVILVVSSSFLKYILPYVSSLFSKYDIDLERVKTKKEEMGTDAGTGTTNDHK